MGWFNDNFGFDIPLLTGKGSIGDALFGESDSPGLFSDPQGAWDEFKNGRTNTVNEDIANKNLEYQKERNAIEDSRYEDETAYNRAFAEEERDYSRALQQKLFEREDTALERQASSLSALGINPLSQNMNGLGAGQAVSPAAAPVDSSRGGTALHNDFKMQDVGLGTLLSSLMESANAIDNINTQGVQRDSLRSTINLQNADVISRQLDNERKAMENLIFANKNNITKSSDGSYSIPNFEYKEQDFSKQDYENKEYSKERNKNEYEHQLDYGTTDSSAWIERTATGASKQAERALDYIGDKANKIGTSIASGAEADYQRIKNFFNFGKKQLNRFSSWWKSHSMDSSEMEKAYRR